MRPRPPVLDFTRSSPTYHMWGLRLSLVTWVYFCPKHHSYIHYSNYAYRPFKSVELLNARIINVLNLTKTYELNICKPQNCISWRIRKRETTWLSLEGVLIFYCSKVFNSGWQTIRATWAWQKNQINMQKNKKKIKGAIYKV